MLSKKQIKKLTQKMVVASFDEKNNLENKKIREFVNLMKKLDRMEAILALEEYLKGLQLQMDKTTLEVRSAISLSSEMKNKILKLMKRNHSFSSSTFQVDASILGGIKIKIADEIINASIKGKIENLRNYGN